MNKRTSRISWIILSLVFLLILWIFKPWFSFKTITAGDWMYVFQNSRTSFNEIYSIWRTSENLGENINIQLHINLLYELEIYFSNFFLNIKWQIIGKIIWFLPFLVLSSLSSFSLMGKLFPGNKVWPLSTLVFLTNSYILMVVGGGQMGVALSYSLAPLVVAKFINLSERIAFKGQGSRLKASLIFALVLAVQIMFDVRIAYVTLIAVGIYFFINGFTSWRVRKHINLLTGLRVNELKKHLLRVTCYGLLVTIIVIGLHAFWILPIIATGNTGIGQLGGAYTSVGAVKFFSFAKFENTISLLHPNWPENIFGKVGFQRPEFLIIPIIAFASLLFVNKRTKNKEQRTKNKNVLFFALLGLLGAFLAKGANPPFGEVYLWMFKHIPGFIMFRDPTKFYLLVVLSYSILIPYTLGKIVERVKELTG